jgi:undecaprenyl diphosphate synthase
MRDQPEPAVSGAQTTGDAWPCHLGIITDGNRRWARENGLSTLEGHWHGANLLRMIAVESFARGVDYVSAYLFSTENWRRPPVEVNGLMDLFEVIATDHVEYLHKHNVLIRFLGQPHGLPRFITSAVDRAEKRTAHNTGGTLALCLNYGGQTEIADAVTALIASGVPAADVSSQIIADFLYAPDIPPLDLIIRTGGEQRLSNFMLWRAAYAELVFVEAMWPAFTIADLETALHNYGVRARRFGR